MRLHHGVTAVMAGLLLAALPAPAEVYRWVDEKGELHFTGDLNQVPARYRHKATAPVTDEKSTLNVTPQEPDPALDAAREERLRALRRMNARDGASPSKSKPRQILGAPAKPEKPQAAPRKYERDCERRMSNGRCYSELNPEWVRWNAERKAQAGPDD